MWELQIPENALRQVHRSSRLKQRVTRGRRALCAYYAHNLAHLAVLDLLQHASSPSCPHSWDLQRYHQPVSQICRWRVDLRIDQKWQPRWSSSKVGTCPRLLRSVQGCLLRVQRQVEQCLEDNLKCSLRKAWLFPRALPRHYAAYQHHPTVHEARQDWDWQHQG